MFRPGHFVAVATVALLTLGVVMVLSAGMSVAGRTSTMPADLFTSRSVIYMGMALLALGVTAWLTPVDWLARRLKPSEQIAPSHGWNHLPLWAGAVGLLAILAIVYIPGIGSARKGSSRWINLQLPGVGDLSVQPSEIAKWGLILVIATYAASMARALPRFFTGLLPALAAVALVAGFIALEDLGTAVLITAVASLLLLSAGARVWHFLAMIPLGLAAFAAAVWKHPYRMERLATFLDPFYDARDAGYHMIQSMSAVAGGEVTGRGLGHGLMKMGFLPEDTTDFLFAIICEELGLAGAALVIVLYMVILYAGLLIVRRAASPVLKLLALGIWATLGLQAIINLGVVTAVLPTKGIALPLLSSGGTGWILTAASLGVLIAIDRHAHQQQASTAAPATLPPPDHDDPASTPTLSPAAT